MTHSANWVNRTVVCSLAKWVNGTDLCPIRNWVIENRNDSFCKLGQRDRSLPKLHIGASGAKIAQLRTGSCGPTLTRK